MIQEICPICLSSEINYTTVCNHKFCNICISEWLLNNNTCPCCRRELYPRNTNLNPDITINLTQGEINITRINNAFNSIF